MSLNPLAVDKKETYTIIIKWAHYWDVKVVCKKKKSKEERGVNKKRF